MDLKQFVERYGLALGVVIALVAVIAVLPGNADDRLASGDADFDLTTGGDPDAAGSDLATGADAVGGEGFDGAAGAAGSGDPAAAGGAASTGGAGDATATGGGGGGAAAQSGGGPRFGAGPHCDGNGRQKGISYLMPPCVEWKPGNNGGATANGVTADKVVILRWLGQMDPATEAILQGASLSDGRPKIKETFDAIFKYANLHHETYGREVVYVDMEASGPSENDEAMKSDALKIAKEIKPFAVIEGDPAAPIPIVLARELAQLGVLCMCTTSASSEFYTELPPLIWSSLPTSTEYAEQSAEYIAKKLWGKKAQFAGDEQLPTQGFKGKTRSFGLLYLEGARGRIEPEAQRARDAFKRAFSRYGMKFDHEAGYIYDPGRNQADVTNLIAGFRQKGITTVVAVWDPLYPILITQEATRQQYFPEWFITGTGLSDTTTAGRLYDQRQWRHAFGISPLWVTWKSVPQSTGYREFKHGKPDGEPGVLVNIYRARVATLFRGIHMAGPKLTNETFARGLVAYPPTGGQPRAPLVFMTRELPTEIKDFVEVWYDHEEQGPDERGTNGSGMIMKTNGGKRYKPGQWTQDPTRAFDPNGAIAISDDPALGGDSGNHERDGHSHDLRRRCLSCA